MSVLDRVYRELLRPKKILFLDDNEYLLKFVREVVAKKFAIEVVVVATVAEARAKLETEYFDAAIIDIVLANGSGIDLYREIVDRWPRIQVAFLTCAASDDYRHEIELIGPARVYSKDRVTNLEFMGRLFSRWEIMPISDFGNYILGSRQ